MEAFKKLGEILGDDMDPFTDEAHRVDDEFDPEGEENIRRDDEKFNILRHSLIGDVSKINKQLRKQRFRKHIGKNQTFYCSREQTPAQPSISKELH